MGDSPNKSLPFKTKKSKIMGRPLGRPLGRPPKDKSKIVTQEKVENTESSEVTTSKEASKDPAEDKFMKRIKRRERFKLKLQEKALKWEELRVQKAKDRDKIKKVSSNPRTVKNILNSAMANRSKSESEVSDLLKTEKKEEKENVTEVKTENISVKTESSQSLTSPSKHVANESKLFKPPESVQLSSSFHSAKSEDKILPQPNPAISPRGPHLPSQPMFYPHPFVQLGSMHPLGLPIIHQIPMAMQQYLQPTLPAAKPFHRPSLLQNSPTTSKPSGISELDKMAAHTLFQQPAHSNNHQKSMNISQLPGKSPITPPAHSHHKRSHDALYSPNYNIPSHPKSLSNRSLLFDFETPKRVRKESGDPSVNQSVKQNSAANEEQPQDLSMKTLCKKTESQSGSDVLDLRFPSPSNSKDDSVKSQKSQMTLNLPKHSMANILKTPNFSKRSSSPNSVFNNKSPVFSSASHTSCHSTTKGDMITSPSSQSSVISPVHPAFPQHFLRSPIPQPSLFPSSSQLQQLYEAQLRATQVAAFEEMMQRDRSMYSRMPFPMFMPQMQLHMNSPKDKNSYAHAK